MSMITDFSYTWFVTSTLCIMSNRFDQIYLWDSLIFVKKSRKWSKYHVIFDMTDNNKRARILIKEKYKFEHMDILLTCIFHLPVHD